MTVRCLLTGHRWWLSHREGVRNCARCRAWQWWDGRGRGRWRPGRAPLYRRILGALVVSRRSGIPMRVCGLPGGRMLLVCRDRPRLRIRRERR